MAKTYKTYRQLLVLLRKRNMSIKKGGQGSRVMRILEKENYYNVVNGYKDIFIDTPATATNDEIYLNGTTFDELYALYNFDREIRHIYLKYLLKIENNFKTVISHEFSKKYGHDNYLKLENFQVNATTDSKELKKIAADNNLLYPQNLSEIQKISAEGNTASVTKLMGDIQQEIARQMNKHHQVVTHYMTHHGYIPLWVLVNVLTFGKITNFYLNMKPDDRKVVAKFFGVPYKELHKYMKILGLARNRCAHDERFYNIEFKQRISVKSIGNNRLIGLKKEPDGSYNQGTNDAFAIAIIFAVLLQKNDVKEFIKSMETAFNKLSKQLTTIPVEKIMAKMGYNSKWKNIIKICKNK